MVSVVFGNVSLALDLFAVSFMNRHLQQLKSSYLLALNELVLAPGSKEEAFEKAAWLDAVRWFTVLQVLRLRRVAEHRVFVWDVGEMFDTVFDPWCAFSLAYNLSCSVCPAATKSFGRVNVKVKEDLGPPFSDRAFVYCRVKKSVPYRVNALCVSRNLVELKSLVKKEVRRLPLLRIWESERVFRNV